jgi:ubiquinone biosynthesis O-methyltransferase
LSPIPAPTETSKTDRATAIAYGIVCHTLFVVGVGAMIVAMFFGMSRSFGRVPTSWSALTNAILLIQFPFLHSLLLSSLGPTMLKRLAPAVIGSRLATTTYAILASIQVLLLFALWTPSGVIWWSATGTVLWFMSGLYTAAWLLLLKAIWDAGLALQTGFLGWWAIANEQAPVYPPMPTIGLFRIVRQPIYVAFTLTLWTVPTWTPDQLAVALFLTTYCLVGPLLKEKRFRRRFGQTFTVYEDRVPYWLPWPRPLIRRNNLSIYGASADWWDDKTRWLRTLQNLVPTRFAFFDPIVGDWRGEAVLDLGCGGGFMAEALSKRGAKVTGIDPSEAAIAAARRHADAHDLEIDYHVARGESLPFTNDAFDIVVCVDVLEHVEDLERVLFEVRRVLRPNGVFLFDTINRTRMASFLLVTIGENVIRLLPRGTHDPSLFIRPEELARKLEAAGFTVGRFAGMGPLGLNRRFDFIFGLLPTMAIQYLGQATRRSSPLEVRGK